LAAQPCSLCSPLRVADFLDHHAQLRVYRGLPSNFLPDTRDVTVYLPPGYHDNEERRYPVFYMHDGQNLFDPLTSFVPGHYWRIEEPLIIVGVNNTGARRMAEYTPTRDPKLGGGEADCYGMLLTEELMPFINESFRTETGPERTGLGGSSLGGLVTMYLGLRYPHVFGRLAVMSPSVWWTQKRILTLVDEAPLPDDPHERARIWLDAGDKEGPRTLPNTDQLDRRLRGRGWQPEINLHYERVNGGTHDEAAWAARVRPMLTWLFPAA
jgi:predicted alpha/beta superfamily hydrolase